MVKAIKAIAFVIPSIFMFVILLLVPEIADPVSVFYVALVGTFIGMDLLSMVQRTKELPAGEFDKLKIWRYALSFVCICALLVVSFYRYKTGADVKLTLTSLSASILIIAGMVIAGLDGNRIATGGVAK